MAAAKQPIHYEYRNGNWWTRARDQLLLALLGEGFSNAQVARRLGTGRNAVARRLTRLREAGIPVDTLRAEAHGSVRASPDELVELAAADACDAHLSDLRTAYPAGPPPDVCVRRGFALHTAGAIHAVMP